MRERISLITTFVYMFLLRGLSNLSCWNPGIVDAMQYSTPFCSAQIDWLIDFLQSCNWMDWIDWWPAASSMMQISQIQAACFSSSIKQPYKSWMQWEDLCTCVCLHWVRIMGWEEEGVGGEGDLGINTHLSTLTKYISLCENPMFSWMNWILFFELLNFQWQRIPYISLIFSTK
jgi:hypothetical protein